MKALKKVVRGVTLAELWATALTFVIMVVCYFVSVVNRNFIKGSMPWTEELALYCMVYMALIGTELGLRDGTQVSVTALTEKLKGTMVGKIVNFIAKVALIVFSCTMLRFSVALVATQLSAGQPTPVMKVPMYVIYISLVISFALIVINQILMLVGEMMHIDMSDITNIDAIIDGIMIRDELVSIFGQKFPCVDKGFGTNKPVDVVIRPEDVDLVKPEEGTLTGTVTHLIFKGVHYEMEVTANGFEWLVHSTDMFPVGTEVGIRVDPFDIQIMNKPASEDEEAVSIDE